MESKMMGVAGGGFLIAVGLCAALAWTSSVSAQESSAGGQAEINLRRSAQSRPYQGREVEGEERQIGPGDTLWRILVRDKGLPGQNFRSYLVVIRGLNPQIKDPEILRVGDKIFIPLRPDQVAERAPGRRTQRQSARTAAGAARPIIGSKPASISIKSSASNLKLTDERKVAQYYALVKDLNPERKTWDTLAEGEIIRLPARPEHQVDRSQVAARREAAPKSRDQSLARGGVSVPARQPTATTRREIATTGGISANSRS